MTLANPEIVDEIKKMVQGDEDVTPVT